MPAAFMMRVAFAVSAARNDWNSAGVLPTGVIPSRVSGTPKRNAS